MFRTILIIFREILNIGEAYNWYVLLVLSSAIVQPTYE